MITEVVRYLGDLGDIATGEKGVDEIEFATIMTHKKQERLEAEAAKKHGFVTGILSRLKKKNDDAAWTRGMLFGWRRVRKSAVVEDTRRRRRGRVIGWAPPVSHALYSNVIGT